MSYEPVFPRVVNVNVGPVPARKVPILGSRGTAHSARGDAAAALQMFHEAEVEAARRQSPERTVTHSFRSRTDATIDTESAAPSVIIMDGSDVGRPSLLAPKPPPGPEGTLHSGGKAKWGVL